MMKFGYQPSNAYDTLFVKHSISNKVVTLIVYVDDIIIAGDDDIEI